MIVIKGTAVKSLISEMSLQEFEKCTQILSNEENEIIERYFEVLELLGMSQESLAQLTIEDLTKFVKVFGKETFEKANIPQEIQIEDVTYKIHDGEFKMLAKDLWQIEKFIKREGRFCIAKSLAVILKRTDVETSWHYNDAHIATKAKDFEDRSVTIFMPLIVEISTQLGKKILLLNDAQRETA